MNIQKNNDNIDIKFKIFEKWLSNTALLCRYNSFVTFFYFVICPFLHNNKDYKNKKLMQLSELIISLSLDVKFENLKKIVFIFQSNNIDSKKCFIRNN